MRPFANPGRTVVLVYAAAACLVLAVAAASRVVDRPVSFFTREPADALDAPAYVGLLSNLGALLWGAAVTACLLAWLATRNPRSPLLWGGLLTALLLADDFFLLHDDYYPSLGIPQRGANAAYFLLTVVYLVVFRDFLRIRGGWMLLLGFGLLGLSAALDSGFREQDALEDAAKFLGIVTWMTFFVLASVDELRRELALRSRRAGCGPTRMP